MQDELNVRYLTLLDSYVGTAIEQLEHWIRDRCVRYAIKLLEQQGPQLQCLLKLRTTLVKY